MMLTDKIDIYAEGATDTTLISDLIDGSIGRDSQFHRTFGYYGDGVSPRTAVMPLDWRSRVEYARPMAGPPPSVRQRKTSPWPSSAPGARRIRRGCARRFAPAS